MNRVESLLASRIEREGPLRYCDVVESALYGPGGFYTEGSGAGHRRDFVTSPEVGTLFGSVVASALDTWWDELGRPDPFVVADCGAGPGTLAVTILAAQPSCSAALRLVLVETSASFRIEHTRRRLPLAHPHELFGSIFDHGDTGRAGMGNTGVEDPGEGWRSRQVAPGGGPLCTSLPGLPECEFHVVLANELLDNLPFNVLQRRGRGWSEVRVDHGHEGFRELLVPAAPAETEAADRFMPETAEGIRIPVLKAANVWLREALSRVRRGGRLVCIDYGAPTAELAGRNGRWLRTYRGHDRGHDPLVGLGTFDVTIDVPFDQLSPAPSRLWTQAEFLRSHGLDDFVTAAEDRWRSNASVADLAALKARSVPSEAKVLTDPTGLGAFLVAEWVR